MAGGAQALRPAVVVVQFFGEPACGLRQAVRLLQIHAREFDGLLVEPLDHRGVVELRVVPENLSPRSLVCQARQLADEMTLVLVLAQGRGDHG